MNRPRALPSLLAAAALCALPAHPAVAGPPADPVPGYLIELSASLNPVANHTFVPRQWANVRGSLGGFYQATTSSDLGNHGTPERYLSLGSPPITYYSTSEKLGGGSFGVWPTDIAGGPGPSGSEPDLRLDDDFSVEVWTRRRGPSHGGPGGEHTFINFRNFDNNPGLGERNPQVFLVDIASTIVAGAFDDRAIDIWMRDQGKTGPGTGGGHDLPDLVLLPQRGDMDPFDHLVITVDAGAGEVKAYLNGAAPVTVAVPITNGFYDSSLPMIHASQFKAAPVESNSIRYNGDIATYRFYDFVLDASQVATNFQFGAGVADGPVMSTEVDQSNAAALSFASFSNQLHELERATSLEPPDWTSTGSVIVGDGGTTTFHHATDAADEAFFRVIIP
jgi:hypothetical protein